MRTSGTKRRSDGQTVCNGRSPNVTLAQNDVADRRDDHFFKKHWSISFSVGMWAFWIGIMIGAYIMRWVEHIP
jgi:hypothetical protein